MQANWHMIAIHILTLFTNITGKMYTMMFLAVEGKMSQGREQQNNLWLKFYLLKRLVEHYKKKETKKNS